MTAVEEKVLEVVEPLVQSSGLELWGIRYRGGKDHAVLQIFVEGENGVSVDQCGELSNLISPALDVADPIAPHYTLEISSPGLDRILFTLEQAAKYVGEQVRADLRMPVEGRRRVTGTLQSCGEDGLMTVVEEDGSVREVSFSNVSLMRIVPVFKTNQKNSKGSK